MDNLFQLAKLPEKLFSLLIQVFETWNSGKIKNQHKEGKKQVQTPKPLVSGNFPWLQGF